MGANQSNLSENNADSVSAKLAARHGFQILRVHPNSPVSEARIFPYFDFIISINGVEVTPDIPNIIGEMARNHVNKPLKLGLYNSRQDEERQVTIVPRSGWGGEGLLGCAIRFCPLDGVRDRVWHILKVHDNSPAQKAGLIAEEDYLIASPDLLLNSQDDFYQLVTQNIRRKIELIVFNCKRVNGEELREIEIVPDFEWGGEGCLGCDVGSGMVHWIPKMAVGEDVDFSLDVGVDVSVGVGAGGSAQVSHSQAQAQAQAQAQTSKSPTPSQSPVQASKSSSPAPLSYTQSSHPQSAALMPQVSVSVPSARPVVNLFDPINTNSTVTQSIFPETVPSPTLAPPPIASSYINHPHHQKEQKPVESDDIPMPNFSVPSDIINQ